MKGVDSLLKESDYLTHLKDALPYSIYWLDSNNVYLWCNQHYSAEMGLPVESIIGQKIDSLLPLPQLKQHLDLITQAEKSKEKVQQIKSDDDSHEHRLLTTIPILDKDPIQFIFIEEPITYENAINISLRKKVADLEKSLAHSKDFLQRIIDFIPAFIFWKDKNGVHLGSNIYHAEVCGYKSPSDIIGKTDSELWGSVLGEQIGKNDLEVMHSRKAMEFEEVSELGRGEKAYYLNSKSPLLDKDDKVIGTIGIALDITERKKMELELTEAKNIAEMSNRSKSEFISNMSHDIRTPISSLVILSEVLMERSTDPESKELSHDCHVCSTQLLHLINQILEVAELDHRISSNKTELFETKQLIQSICELLGPSAMIKKLNLLTEIDPQIPPKLHGQKQVIYRILLNLVSNAIKFTEEGHVKISAQLIEAKDNRVILDLEVSDTGIGIPKDQQNQIFQKFKRLSSSDKGHYKGFGIGLYIVDELAKSIDAVITVESSPGEGATFTIRLPLDVAQAS